jgi:hypothetical protein
LRFSICSAIFFSHETGRQSEGEKEKRSVRPDILCCDRSGSQKDLTGVKEHENDPIDPKDHDAMDDAVEDL